MFFKTIDINGFGKLQNKKIELENGLNVINGNNESGKSTLSNYIRAMFYGISKNKDGNKFSDFERYKPWGDIPFGGSLMYEYLGKDYTIFRDFNKNNSKVYDAAGNDITNEFNKDKTRGVEIGLKHFNIDEESFKNTFLVRQSDTEVGNNEQRNIIQKLTNMVQLGEEGTSYEKTKSKLEKMAVDEVGTLRTQNKPINIINREIASYSKIKDELIHNKERNIEVDEKIRSIGLKNEKMSKAYEEVKAVYDVRKKYEGILSEKMNAFDTAKKIMDKEKVEYEKSKKKRMLEGSIAIAVLFIIIISILIVVKNYVLAIASVGLAVCFIMLYKELEKKDRREFTELNFDIIKEELNKKEQKELQILKEKGIRESLLDRRTASLKELLDGYEKSKQELILEEHKLNIEKNSLKNDVMKLTETEENLQNAIAKKEELKSLEKSIILAINVLEESYEEIKSEIIPEITRLIKENVFKTTDGKYSEVIYNDAQGLLVKNTNGELITIDKLSIGTIDQIYLGFRLAIANKLENIPLILDETFAYYDDERLENFLKILSKMSEEKQIIILTCSNRETELLNKCNILFNHKEL